MANLDTVFKDKREMVKSELIPFFNLNYFVNLLTRCKASNRIFEEIIQPNKWANIS